MEALIPLDPSIRTALGMHEALRRLGVTPERIFVTAEAGQLCVALFPDQGPCGFPLGPEPTADCEAAWQNAATWWNTTQDEQARNLIWLHFLSGVDAARLRALVSSFTWSSVEA